MSYGDTEVSEVEAGSAGSPPPGGGPNGGCRSGGRYGIISQRIPTIHGVPIDPVKLRTGQLQEFKSKHHLVH